MLPFTERDFFDLFERYNEAIWPLQIAAYALGAVALAAVFAPRRWAAPAALFALALMWAWTGASYHWAFFALINPIARLFAALFIAQALILAWAALRGRLELAPAGSASAVVGWAFIAYAAVAYPALNALFGHAYPRTPSFGVTPCPLVIFTLGVLLLSRARASWILFAIPVLWAAIGGSAAFLLNVPPDLALPLGAIVAVALNARKPRD